MYKKPTKKGIRHAMNCGWTKEQAKRGYEIFNFNGLDLFEIECIGDCYLADEDIDDEAASVEAERSGFCKIIPTNELPNPFVIDGIDRRYFGWIDTSENRRAIADYCKH